MGPTSVRVGKVAAHSGRMEDIYENPQWLTNTMQLVYKKFASARDECIFITVSMNPLCILACQGIAHNLYTYIYALISDV